MKFSDLQFYAQTKGPYGYQALAFFPNGYGVSVVRSPMSYGGPEGLYELAVLKGDKDAWILTYETEVTDDVLGYLTESDVEMYMNAVKSLI